MASFDVPKRLHAAQHATGGADAISPASIGAAPASRFLTGAGSPEGVTAAPIGTTYTDTAVTAGAVEWTKFTGTGTTGWRVTKGDTGLRNITSLLTAGVKASNPSMSLHVRRDVGRVYIYMTETAAGTATGAVLLATIPAGFTNPEQPTGYAFAPVYDPATNVPATSKSLKQNAAALYLIGAGPARQESELSFSTKSAWPTVLPGTPA